MTLKKILLSDDRRGMLNMNPLSDFSRLDAVIAE